MASSVPAQILDQEVRHLGDRKDEDEVVEELERSRLLLRAPHTTRVEADRREGHGDGLGDAPLAPGRHAFESMTGQSAPADRMA